MRDSVALNDAVRQYPFASARYQRVFNQRAEELGFDFRWQQDTRDFNSIEPGEIKQGDSTPSSFSPQLKADLKRVLDEVEKERLQLLDQSAKLHQHAAKILSGDLIGNHGGGIHGGEGLNLASGAFARFVERFQMREYTLDLCPQNK